MTWFPALHPAAMLCWFLPVIGLTVFAASPVLAAVSLAASLLTLVCLERGRIWRTLGWYLIIFIALTAANPFFVRRGATPLLFINGNPVTLEALAAGAVLAGQLLAALTWFRCLGAILPAGGWLNMLGRKLPKTGLLLSMSLRSVPLFIRRFAAIREVQRALAPERGRLKTAAAVFSAAVTWSLEQAMMTGDTLRARGYGSKLQFSRTELAGRFSIYRRAAVDRVAAVWFLLAAAGTAVLLGAGGLAVEFYPSIALPAVSWRAAAGYLLFGLLVCWPVIFEIWGWLRWRYALSKI